MNTMTTLGAATTNATAGPVRLVNTDAASAAPTGAAIAVLLGGAVLGMLVAGFWNVRAVDGLGLAMFVTPVIGPFEGKSAGFAMHGYGFGALFGVLAGLAATFTASNLASFALIPILIVTNARVERRRPVTQLLAVMAGCVALVGALYGVFYGRLGPDGAAAFHAGPIRSAQSFTLFGALGLLLLGWAAIEAGVARSATASMRAALARPLAAAALAGVVIGLFSIGRPLAVFREALLYAAQPAFIPYSAMTAALAALATLVGSALVLAVLTQVAGARVSVWINRRPQLAERLAAGALAAGGSFLLFYWCITRVWPATGRWGFALGWYT
jgi:hypothetical protein